MNTEPGDWSNATFAGLRRAQLRRSLALTVRERLLALEHLCEISARLSATSRDRDRHQVGPVDPVQASPQ